MTYTAATAAAAVETLLLLLRHCLHFARFGGDDQAGAPRGLRGGCDASLLLLMHAPPAAEGPPNSYVCALKCSQVCPVPYSSQFEHCQRSKALRAVLAQGGATPGAAVVQFRSIANCRKRCMLYWHRGASHGAAVRQQWPVTAAGRRQIAAAAAI